MSDKLVSDTGAFALVPEWLLDAGISDGALRLYAVLARHADKSTGVAWPSRARLAERCRCSTDTVDRRLKELVDLGALSVKAAYSERGDRTSNTYTVHRAPTRTDAAGGPRERGEGGRAGAAQTRVTERETDNESDEPKLVDVPKTKKERPRDPIFDALASVFPVATKSEQTRTGMVAAELRKLKPVPEVEEIVRRARWARSEWPTGTVMTVSKNWTMIGERLHGRAPERVEEERDPQSGMQTRSER